MDPLADFVFVGGSLMHVTDNKFVGLLCFGLAALILILWQVVARRASDKVYTVMMTGLTYYWFGMMILAVVAVWYYDAQLYWQIGTAITLAIFYTSYFKLEEKSRRIRKRG